MEQPTTPEQLADTIVREWRRHYPIHPKRQTAGSLAQTARDMALLPTHVPLLVSAEEFKTMGGDPARAGQAVLSFGYTIKVDPRAQEAAPARPKPLTDEQQKAIAQQVVADWRKECPFNQWNDRIDDLVSRAVKAGAGKDFGALLVTAEEYNKLIDGYVNAQTHWNAVHREAKRDELKAASMFVRGCVIIARQPADTTLPEFIESVLEDIKINLADGHRFDGLLFGMRGVPTSDPVEPNPAPIMHSVEMQPLPIPTRLKTVMDEIVALPMVSDKAFNQLLERFIADMRAARAKGKQ